ncbi:voltage-gated chloride channel family protein [Danxiaibacter flavus]|uniref:Voltage-gated chloride channel family protein n=1 Tax=Danxiaibacter flavus TaxID=3049108 RepID=A0ABV3ZPS6_9BACT|nr:voltage-gated chloride channel family protein [Chitinophagaceae bacterium DXS]
MDKRKYSLEHFFVFSHLLKWTLIVLPLALCIGSVVAFFLWSLEQVTQHRLDHPWLLYLLPVAGIVIYLMYTYLGKESESGNNLIIDEIHEPRKGVPAIMTPLVLLGTLITHLFGGSAGREGTAVQMGGSIANLYARVIKLKRQDLSILLMTGIAAGFGAVFGTPVTGTIFAMEVLALGSIKHTALVPCFIAALLADATCTAWGIHHTEYHILFVDDDHAYLPFLHIDLPLLIKSIFAGVLFGLAGFFFSQLSHGIKKTANRYIPYKWLIPAVGGCIIILLTFILQTDSYLGLGVSNPNPASVSIVSCFKEGGATYWSWFWKLLFTAVTLGLGFKGGEVTPLFFIGAALGNTIGTITGAPVDLMAGLGFIAVFAGATNTPIACTIMGIELFGSNNILYYAVACFTAYYFSGHSGIYGAQRIGQAKIDLLKKDMNKRLNDL